MSERAPEGAIEMLEVSGPESPRRPSLPDHGWTAMFTIALIMATGINRFGAVGSFFSLNTVINVVLAVSVIVQAVAQVVALTVCAAATRACVGPTANGCIRCPA